MQLTTCSPFHKAPVEAFGKATLSIWETKTIAMTTKTIGQDAMH